MSVWHLLRKLELAVVVGIKHAAQMGNLDARLQELRRQDFTVIMNQVELSDSS